MVLSRAAVDEVDWSGPESPSPGIGHVKEGLLLLDPSGPIWGLSTRSGAGCELATVAGIGLMAHSVVGRSYR